MILQSADAPGLARLQVDSVLGALWVQTHFEQSEWDTLLSGQACFGMDYLSDLLSDARQAGLAVRCLVVVAAES
ncbi:MAG: hypothetical protein O2972_04435 [Cyanobacteria bacterium]|nr:hypothetical protein [Cyanobacteriota bacterium]